MQNDSVGPVAHTDGGCLGNPGPGGWGVHIEFPDGRVVELGGGEAHTTNNRMELRAAIEAARATAGYPQVTIITDSQYVRRGVTEWLAGWKRKGWITSTGQPVLNRDLWEELDRANGPHITWDWTRGHSGDPGNERCDEIAGWFSRLIGPLPNGRRPAARPTRSPAPGASTPRARPERAAPGPTGPASASPGSGPAGTVYLSVVDGILKRHATWGECEARVRGVGRALFKKVRNREEERDVLRRWGITEADLFGV
ncbi:MAG: ribonuclease HI [Chloroflexi bacterium]|nr:ribonuclease HI [Chloroflexota bacterium]